MARKRSRAATAGMKPKKTITASQRRARRVNIEVARRAKKSGQKGSSKGAGGPADAKAIKARKHGKTEAQIQAKLASGSWKRGGSSYLRSSEAAYYLRERHTYGRSKADARKYAIKRAEAQSKRFIKGGVFSVD